MSCIPNFFLILHVVSLKMCMWLGNFPQSIFYFLFLFELVNYVIFRHHTFISIHRVVRSFWKYVMFSVYTEHGWAHGSNTVYSVKHGVTGTSIEPQPCLGMSRYDLDSNVARVCANKARYTRSSKVCHGLNRICKTTFIRLLYGSKYVLVRSVTA